MAVYLTILEYGDTVLGMDLSSGGHLTHGHKLNFSGISYNFVGYGVSKDNEMIDYDEVRSLALKHKPKLIVAVPVLILDSLILRNLERYLMKLAPT